LQTKEAGYQRSGPGQEGKKVFHPDPKKVDTEGHPNLMREKEREKVHLLRGGGAHGSVTHQEPSFPWKRGSHKKMLVVSTGGTKNGKGECVPPGGEKKVTKDSKSQKKKNRRKLHVVLEKRGGQSVKGEKEEDALRPSALTKEGDQRRGDAEWLRPR